MKVFQFNKGVSGEEYERWKEYIESKDKDAVVLPVYLDLVDSGEQGFSFLLSDEDPEDEPEEEE